MYPWGVLGGETGLRSTKRLVRADGSEKWLPAKSEGIKVKEGDLLYFNTWGGGGWGDPYQRDPELVRQDVDRRLVTSRRCCTLRCGYQRRRCCRRCCYGCAARRACGCSR